VGSSRPSVQGRLRGVTHYVALRTRDGEKVQRCEDLQSRLLREKEDLARQCAGVQREIEEGHQLLRARECQIKELEAKDA
jgi:hypothetical protein